MYFGETTFKSVFLWRSVQLPFIPPPQTEIFRQQLGTAHWAAPSFCRGHKEHGQPHCPAQWKQVFSEQSVQTNYHLTLHQKTSASPKSAQSRARWQGRAQCHCPAPEQWGAPGCCCFTAPESTPAQQWDPLGPFSHEYSHPKGAATSWLHSCPYSLKAAWRHHTLVLGSEANGFFSYLLV